MGTTPSDRLNQLFAGQSRPALPTPGQPHFSEQEFEQKAAKEANFWQIPSTAQYPREIKKSASRKERNIDLFTSSDDDDYTSSFVKKPSMKSPTKKNTKPKPRNMPEPNAFDCSKDAHIESKGPIEYLAKGKKPSKHNVDDEVSRSSDSDGDSIPTSDVYGNPTTGQFCQFYLAAKFPYKYMNDSNDRVSRHFFASNKFYDRSWDM